MNRISLTCMLVAFQLEVLYHNLAKMCLSSAFFS